MSDETSWPNEDPAPRGEASGTTGTERRLGTTATSHHAFHCLRACHLTCECRYMYVNRLFDQGPYVLQCHILAIIIQSAAR